MLHHILTHPEDGAWADLHCTESSEYVPDTEVVSTPINPCDDAIGEERWVGQTSRENLFFADELTN